MRLLVARFVALLVCGGTLCAVATCRREVPPVQPAETRPAGPTPTAVPAVDPHWPDAIPAAYSPAEPGARALPSAIAPERPAPPADAGVDGPPLLQAIPDAKYPIVHDSGTPLAPLPTSPMPLG